MAQIIMILVLLTVFGGWPIFLGILVLGGGISFFGGALKRPGGLVGIGLIVLAIILTNVGPEPSTAPLPWEIFVLSLLTFGIILCAVAPRPANAPTQSNHVLEPMTAPEKNVANLPVEQSAAERARAAREWLAHIRKRAAMKRAARKRAAEVYAQIEMEIDAEAYTDPKTGRRVIRL